MPPCVPRSTKCGPLLRPSEKWATSPAVRFASIRRALRTPCSLNQSCLAFSRATSTLAFNNHVSEAISRGELVSVLEKFCAPFPGYYLYYPQRRQASRSLRALIDYLHAWRRTSRSTKRRRV